MVTIPAQRPGGAPMTGHRKPRGDSEVRRLAIANFLWTEFRNCRCLIVPGNDLRAAEVVAQPRQRILNSTGVTAQGVL